MVLFLLVLDLDFVGRHGSDALGESVGKRSELLAGRGLVSRVESCGKRELALLRGLLVGAVDLVKGEVEGEGDW